MRGHTRKHGKGWQAIWWVDGRQKSKAGFPTQTEAQAHLNKVLTALQDGTYVAPDKLTVSEYLTETWLPAIRATIRPTTLEGYTVNATKHIGPRIGRRPLQKLTAANINAMYADLAENGKRTGPGGLAPNSIRRIHATLHRALGDAVKWGYLSRNPAAAADPPRPENRHDMRVWSPEQLRAFINSVVNDRLWAMWFLFITTGMRRGEVCGLRWSDVDFEHGSISIQQTRVPVGGKVVVSEPKTKKSRRVVPLDDSTLAALEAWKKQQEAEAEEWGDCWTDTGLVFTKESGESYYPQHITAMFKKLSGRAGLPRIRLHEVRHSYGTAALQAGINPKVVSERLGHATVSITLDVYSHATKSISEEAADRVAKTILSDGALTKD